MKISEAIFALVLGVGVSIDAFGSDLPPAYSSAYVFTDSPGIFRAANEIVTNFGAPSTVDYIDSHNLQFNLPGVPNDYIVAANAVASPFGGTLSENAYTSVSAHAEWNGVIVGQASVVYSFRIADPLQRVLPVRFDYKSAEQSGFFSNGETFYANGLGDTQLAMGLFDATTGENLKLLFTRCILTCSSDGLEPLVLGSGSFSIPLKTNANYRISMTVVAKAGYLNGYGIQQGINYAFADAFLDPYLSIDAAYTGYRFDFSPGVRNVVPAVPEPNSAMLMFLGLIIAGLALNQANARVTQ